MKGFIGIGLVIKLESLGCGCDSAHLSHSEELGGDGGIESFGIVKSSPKQSAGV